MSGQLLADGAVVLTVYAVGRCGRVRIGVYADGTATVDGRVSPTIPEAMRAAGFGVRAQGLRQVMNSLKRNDCAGRILPGPRIKPHKWFVELQSCQRPRKGARLGRRKRSPDGLGKNWRAAARGR